MANINPAALSSKFADSDSACLFNLAANFRHRKWSRKRAGPDWLTHISTSFDRGYKLLTWLTYLNKLPMTRRRKTHNTESAPGYGEKLLHSIWSLDQNIFNYCYIILYVYIYCIYTYIRSSYIYI